jgi:DNA replication protein DnaC
MCSIEIKKNNAMVLDIPEFNCDSNPLGEHLNKYEMLSHLNSFSFTAIIGKPGSGKTSLLVSFLTGKKEKKVFRKVFDHIQLVMPSSSRNSMKKNVSKNYCPEKTYEELNFDTINTIYDSLKNASEEKETTLLILDDVGAVLKNADIAKKLRQIIYNRRHLKTHIVILLQSYLSVPKEIRKLITNCFTFKPSKVEFENFCEELFKTKKDMALELMKVAYSDTENHPYVMLNIESQKMYKGFDEIIIHEKDV